MCWRETILDKMRLEAMRARAGGATSVEAGEPPESLDAVQADLFEKLGPRDQPDGAVG